MKRITIKFTALLFSSCLLALSSCVQKQNFPRSGNGLSNEHTKPFTLVFRDRKSGAITLDATPEVAEKLSFSAAR